MEIEAQIWFLSMANKKSFTLCQPPQYPPNKSQAETPCIIIFQRARPLFIYQSVSKSFPDGELQNGSKDWKPCGGLKRGREGFGLIDQANVYLVSNRKEWESVCKSKGGKNTTKQFYISCFDVNKFSARIAHKILLIQFVKIQNKSKIEKQTIYFFRSFIRWGSVALPR